MPALCHDHLRVSQQFAAIQEMLVPITEKHHKKP